MDDEKNYIQEYSGSPTGSYEQTDAQREVDMVHRKGSVLGEAAVLYGDVQTAEQMGYVDRGLKSRHIQFIALGGTIGTGLFVGIGGALANYGPLSILLGYTITGLFIYAMMQSLGEMATWLPLPGAIPQMATRYADPALGFAVGWNQWYANALTQCSEISAAATVISYWPNSVNPAVWITIIIVVIVCLNIFAIQIYGEAEFWFAALKITTICGLLILSFIICLGGTPRHHRLGFQYWHNPGAMNIVPTTVHVAPNTGRFLAFFSCLLNAAFSYGGVESVAVAAGEAANPRKNIPKAVRRVFWRILFFYALGSLAIGIICPSNAPDLVSGSGTAESSPWVIGIKIALIPALDSIINAVILTSAISSGNAFCYTGSRYLFALAQNGQAPKFFLKCSKRGVPYYCVSFTAIWACLTYITVSSGASTVFGWFLNLTTIANLWTWVVICISSIRFTKALKAQGVDRNTLPFKSPFQPFLAWAALVFFLMIIIFAGWNVFVDGAWDNETFVTSYVGTPIFFIFYAFWKIYKRTPFVKPADADLWTGKAAIDAEVWPEDIPKNFIEKVWYWIA